MTSLTLISHQLCPYVQRSVIALEEKAIPHQRVYIDLSNKPDWFAALSPLGRVPVLKAGEAVVFESQVIVEYLDDITPGSLHPADPLEKARHRAWIEFGSETLNAIAGFYNAVDGALFEDKRRALRAKFKRVEREIEGPFFAGDRFHIIDGVWGTIFRYFDVFDEIADCDVLSGLPKVAFWRRAVSERPSVAGAVAADYSARLRAFLLARDSYLSGLIRQAG
ncbi:MAG: glutathione S-transferase family protein [Amphiplicatus sp.]